jgi:cytochrome c oxidase accessory protein FixG
MNAPPAPPAPRAPADAPLRVLPTLNRDGSRRWIHPRLSRGRFLRARRVVAAVLILVFTLLPWIKVGGVQSILLDIPGRRFTLFGTTFLPTDTLLLMLLVVGILLAIFLLTALLGRVWCGWACPQTVYMEFVYRPIERFFEGGPERRRRTAGSGLRRVLKHAAFLLVSLYLAHTFLAYFVPVESLFQWMRQSPARHPTAFLVMAATTGLMLFDFAFFREQTCIVACPYGRLQSVLLDRDSLVIGYDRARGEPRGAVRRGAGAPRGDCVDCGLCVVTCPTGIDIRDGLQMECIGCAQCIDACDAVMERVGRPRGLIRYSSPSALESGRRRLVRPRVILYPLLLLGVAAAFGAVVAQRQSADVFLQRVGTAPYHTLPGGEIANDLVIKIVNRSGETRRYRIAVDGVAGARVIGPDPLLELAPGASGAAEAQIAAPPGSFRQSRATARVTVRNGVDLEITRNYRLQGPFAAPPAEQPQ